MAARRPAWLLLAGLLAALAAGSGCTDSGGGNPVAPHPTPAPGIMSAVVNGQVWSAGGGTASPAAAIYTEDPADTSLLLGGHRFYSDGSGSYALIFVRSFRGPGTYGLALETGSTSGGRATFTAYTAAHDTTAYPTDASHTGSITVTLFDPITRDVRGTFAFTGYDPASATIVTVTGGSFDVSY